MLQTVTRIKICGITNIEDAQAAVEYGADALGFICVQESPRYVPVETAYQIGRTIPPFVSKVAVFRDWADRLGNMPRYFDTFQYYTNERGFRHLTGMDGYSNQRNIRAYRIRDAESLKEIETSYREAYAILLDTYHQDRLGGSGETFDWELAREAKARFDRPLILAGGLTPDNVEEAIRKVRPYAVDVSSGVEAEPGHKDHGKLNAFLQAVYRADSARED
jgi:phosphoribosylanthranilate isomerase